MDVQTGAVLGMHVAASAVQDGRKRGIAIAMTRFSEEQLGSLSAIEDDADENLLSTPGRQEVGGLE